MNVLHIYDGESQPDGESEPVELRIDLERKQAAN